MRTEATPQAEAMWQRLCLDSRTSGGQEETVTYLTEVLRPVLRPRERVFLCFPDRTPGSFGDLLTRAVRALDATILNWGPDYRWKALLRQAFSSRATCIAGSSELLLGLSKLSRATRTPLFARNVILGGELCGYAVENTLRRELDCRVWHLYCPCGIPALGFAPDGKPVTLRPGLLAAVLEGGKVRSEGKDGEIALGLVQYPDVWYPTGDTGRLTQSKGGPLLTGLRRGSFSLRNADCLDEALLRWSSVLDYRTGRTDSGLELELVTFPGEPLPKLPTCARRVIRPWNPDADMPFFLQHHTAGQAEEWTG